MAKFLGIKATHQLMKDRLVEYITSQYFGDSKLLLDAASDLLRKEGNLFQKPYIESTPSYKKIPDGIRNLNIDNSVKDFFIELMELNLGVFPTPFKHQIDSLEAFEKGKNLFVATGTGSGKTECFMWPIIYKLIYEAIHHPKTWAKRGVRTILIYPMNALVSDQISRLRSIIGDYDNKFVTLLRKYAGDSRRPQFGMYTGRTPYSGNSLNEKNNEDIAQSYKDTYLIDDSLTEEEINEKRKDIEGLAKIHKYPSKDMPKFVEALNNNTVQSYDSANDAELLLRYEIQNNTPDILITNYSMLEFMLIRKIENNIWSDTKCWLNESGDNKLLIVIDEAHMYAGASGGEVALLIRRLFSRLGISQNKVQFIMTSASMPNSSEEDKKYIENFVENLSSCKSESFTYLFGEREKLSLSNSVSFNAQKLASLNLNGALLDDDSIDKNIRIFSKEIFNADAGENPRVWLYENISRYEPFVKLMNACRGTAVSYDKLEKLTIGDSSPINDKAFENLLVLAPLAKDKNSNVLFPARIHLFFRGLNGLYACLNPNCKEHHAGDGLHIGSLFSKELNQCPHCHSKIYEIINDRRCGALFIKTFINKMDLHSVSVICWPKRGIDEKEDLIMCPLYIVPDGYDISKRPKETDVCYFDFMSGKLYPNNISPDTCIKVLRSYNLVDDVITYKTCPKCGKRFNFVGLSDFKVKGNPPFYNIIKAQFDAQPMNKKPTRFTPNGGRKVLLFSDSRQSAALLARDMTKLADANSFRKAIYLSMQELYINAGLKEFDMSYLYVAFVKVCYENRLRFFYGNGLDKLEDDKIKYKKIKDLSDRRGIRLTFERLKMTINDESEMYQSALIEVFCSPTVNFHKLGLGYIAPLDDLLDDALCQINIPNFSKEEFIHIFSAFLVNSFTDSFAFDNTVEEKVRKTVKYIKGNRYGFIKYEPYVNDKVKQKYPNDYKNIYETIIELFYGKKDEYYFLNLDTVKIVLTGEDKKWFRCKRCGAIHPFSIEGGCAICESSDVEENFISEFKQMDYWRNPILSDLMINSLDTEEHTAQLSFKDQKIETWAKTEDYEMRFQDINVEKINTNPIDILSCTTTMEVGIDIGSLTGIGLRNVPPLRENYQQRAGRAGRRGSSLSTISVYAQGGPHDTYYFNHPQKIIDGNPRKPWIDIRSEKIIYRHFNLIALTKFFEDKTVSLYDCTTKRFKNNKKQFYDYVEQLSFTDEEKELLFLGHNIQNFKKNLINDLDNFLNNFDDKNTKLFDDIFSTGILPTYSFPLDVIDFTIQDANGEVKLSPQRGIDVAISEYAPGRNIVVDKKTYKCGGLYNPTPHKDQTNIYKPAEPYFKPENGYISKIYTCSNKACGWFGKEKPTNGLCPFCGEPLDESCEHEMIRPWGFAPANAKALDEGDATEEMTFADEPCYSATPSEDLTDTKYLNLRICNRKNEEIIILNKGNNSNGFDICKECGAAMPRDDNPERTLKSNNIGAPFKVGSRQVNCLHKNVAEGIYLGTSFRTDMFFMQISINPSVINTDELILKSAAITLSETMKLAASRILDIAYNDISVGTRIRNSSNKKYVDIYFYDAISSGAGYSTQIENYLDEIFKSSLEILKSGDDSDICNFWNQRIQRYFNKLLANNLLSWLIDGTLPKEFNEAETKNICVPLVHSLKNEYNIECSIKGNNIYIDSEKYTLKPAFLKCSESSISDMDIFYSLPSLLIKIKSVI